MQVRLRRKGEKEVAEKYNAQCAHLKKLREKRLHEVRGDLWALEKEHKRVMEAYELVQKKLRKFQKKEEDEKNWRGRLH